MQVLILDEHPDLDDPRRLRHQRTCLTNNYKVFRIHFDIHRKQSKIELLTCNNTKLAIVGMKYFSQKYINEVFFVLHLLFQRKQHWFSLLKDTLHLSQDDDTVIHVHDPQLLILASRIKKYFRNSKIVYDRHEIFEHLLIFHIPVYFIFEKIWNRCIDGVVFVVESYLDTLKSLFPNSQLTIVPNYPQLDAFLLNQARDKLLSQELSHRKTFVYFGTLDWIKRSKSSVYDITPLLNFAEYVLPKRNDVDIIIGGAVTSDELKNEVNRLMSKYPDNFHYTGYLDNKTVLEYTINADFGVAFANPRSKYWGKTSPNKVFEFMNCGVIPITCENVDSSDIIKKCGLVFPRYSSQSYVFSEIDRYLDTPELFLDKRREILQYKENFTYDSVSCRYCELYEKLFQ